jgi:hypothetical protein
MACEILDYKQVLFVLWGKPELADLERIRERVATLRPIVGPLVFIARVPVGAEPPSDEMRKEMARTMAEVVPQFVSYHAVFEGTGFVSAAKRAVLSTLFLASRMRAKYYVHAHMYEVASAVSPSMCNDVIAALKVFEDQRALNHRIESLRPPAGRAHGSVAVEQRAKY